MSIPLRQRLIMDGLLGADRGLTIQALARSTATSPRTVHRLLPGIATMLQHYGLRLVRKAGVGVRLIGAPAQMAVLRRDLHGTAVTAVRPAERQAWLAARLLSAHQCVKLFSLADDLQVTITTVASDLDQLGEWFASRGLRLTRKRGCGVQLTGDERDRRRACADFVLEHMSETELSELIAGKEVPKTSRDALLQPALMLVGRERLRQAGELVRQLEREQSPAYAPIAAAEIALQLALMLERAAQFRAPGPPRPALDPLDYDKELRLAFHLLGQLRAVCPHLDLSAEAPHFALQLLGAKRRAAPDQMAGVAAGLRAQVRIFLRECDARLKSSLSSDPLLWEGLIAHLEPALHRVAHGLPIRNPLLPEIKRDYGQLFAVALEAAAAAFSECRLPETETGFLVLHLGAALERQQRTRFRVLVVCCAGIGTSRILTSRLRSELPELEIVGELPAFEAARQPGDAHDLILSTIPLSLPEEQYLLVSPLLPEGDQQRVRACLRRLRADRRPAAAEPLGSVTMRELQARQRRLACGVTLLGRFFVHRIAGGPWTLSALAGRFCATLSRRHGLKDPDAMARALTEGCAPSRLVIPGSSLALWHARGPGVARPSLSLFRLDVPMAPPASGSAAPGVFDHCLLMLAPPRLPREELEVLSRISTLLLEPGIRATLAHGDEQDIRDALARALEPVDRASAAARFPA